MNSTAILHSCDGLVIPFSNPTNPKRRRRTDRDQTHEFGLTHAITLMLGRYLDSSGEPRSDPRLSKHRHQHECCGE